MKKWFWLWSILLISVNASADAPQLMVGAAAFDITPPIGTPLGGSGGFPRRYKYLLDWFGQHPYANFFTPSQGVHDPLYSKAMVLKNHKSKILFLSLDLVGVTSELYEMLSKDLKKKGFDDVFISATHTHSGSGALSKSWLWEILAMDQFSPVVYEQFMQGVQHSIDLAHESMVPAKLYSASFDVPEIHRNRRQGQTAIDHQANLLIAKTEDDRQTIGGIVNYAVHGMAMGGSGFLFSADISGGIERHLSTLFSAQGSKKPTFLFVNGSEGDITTVYGGSEGVEKAGAIFATKASVVAPVLNPVDSDWNISKIAVKMPKARMNVQVCGAKIGKKPLKLQLPIDSKAAPRTATVWQIELGDIRIMTFPGEPTTAIGNAAKAISESHGGKNNWIFGLTNGHMAYFVTPEEYWAGGIEGCSALHGPNASGTLLKAHEQILSTRKKESLIN